jgi:hypothetical protein
VESYVTTDGQSASLSWYKAPIWSLRPDIYYCHTVAGLLMWSALSDERTGLSFIIADGPRQCSHSRVRIPWYSRPYFTVSDPGRPLSFPPTTRRVTAEVFEPATTLDRSDVRYTVPSYNSSARTPRKTLSSIIKNACFLILAIDVLLLTACASGMCLPSRCLAMDTCVRVCCMTEHL